MNFLSWLHYFACMIGDNLIRLRWLHRTTSWIMNIKKKDLWMQHIKNECCSSLWINTSVVYTYMYHVGLPGLCWIFWMAYAIHWSQGLYSLSGKTFYHQLSRNPEAARLDVIMIVSQWNLTGISTALLPMCLSNFRAIGKVIARISRLRDLTRSCGKTSVRLILIDFWLNIFICHLWQVHNK